jgi:hypothetical protein
VAGRRREQGSISTAKLRPRDLATQHRDLVAQDQQYLARHDPAQKLYSVALFADAGAPGPVDPDWPPGSGAPIPEDVAEAGRVFGYRVLPAP